MCYVKSDYVLTIDYFCDWVIIKDLVDRALRVSNPGLEYLCHYQLQLYDQTYVWGRGIISNTHTSNVMFLN